MYAKSDTIDDHWHDPVWRLYAQRRTQPLTSSFLISCFLAAINILMTDGTVSIGDGKSGSESSPSRRRASNLAPPSVSSSAPVAAGRVKRSPQGSVAGESSTKGSERDDMEEVSNEEGQCDHFQCLSRHLNRPCEIRSDRKERVNNAC